MGHNAPFEEPQASNKSITSCNKLAQVSGSYISVFLRAGTHLKVRDEEISALPDSRALRNTSVADEQLRRGPRLHVCHAVPNYNCAGQM
jgi:hypothetical protein